MIDVTCSIDGCAKPRGTYRSGVCGMHYQRLRHGSTEVTRRPTALERFVDKIAPQEDGCWHWTGSLSNTGYGHFYFQNRGDTAHRAAYTLFVGDVPAGLDLDHLCRVRHCCNPDHLEPVTRRVNLLRGDTWTARNAAKTHCINGHEFTPENTQIRNDGFRNCRSCVAIRSKARRRG